MESRDPGEPANPRPSPLSQAPISAPRAPRALLQRRIHGQIIRPSSVTQVDAPWSWQAQHQLPVFTGRQGAGNHGVKEAKHPSITWNLGDDIPVGGPFKYDTRSKEDWALENGEPPPEPTKYGWERWVYYKEGGNGTPEDPVIYWLEKVDDDARRNACNTIARKVARDTKCGYIWLIKGNHTLSYGYKNGKIVSKTPVRSDPHLTVRYGTHSNHCNIHGHIFVKIGDDGKPVDIADRRFELPDDDHRVVQLFHWTVQRMSVPSVPVAVQRQAVRLGHQEMIAARRHKASRSPTR